jgi:hypothetical protein
MIDYSIIRNWSLTIYIICLALLVITLLIGRSVNGSRSWLGLFGFGIQPSEFTKLAAVLILARFFEDHRKQIRQLSVFLRGLSFALIPMGLVSALVSGYCFYCGSSETIPYVYYTVWCFYSSPWSSSGITAVFSAASDDAGTGACRSVSFWSPYLFIFTFIGCFLDRILADKK